MTIEQISFNKGRSAECTSMRPLLIILNYHFGYMLSDVTFWVFLLKFICLVKTISHDNSHILMWSYLNKWHGNL